MKNQLLFLFLLLSFHLWGQNKSTISGFILDSSSREPLIGANISVINDRYGGTTSNESGFFSITSSQQLPITIVVSYIGYQSKEVKINSSENTEIFLEPGIEIEEVEVVQFELKDHVRKNQVGIMKLTSKEITDLPNFFGETDIIKTLQLTPGVQSGGEGQSDLYVRGGGPDQNLILLDGIPLYYVSHFGGIISVFNSDAISHTTLIKGGFPARYGSRLSSVLDIQMKNGNRQKFSGQGSIGLLSGKILLEGPIKKDKASFLLSLRKNILPVFKIFGSEMDYKFYDINAKISYSISTKDNLFISTYVGHDDVGTKNKIYRNGFKQNDKKSTNWGNKMIGFRWDHIFSDRIFCSSSFYYSGYSNNNLFNYNSVSDTTNTKIESHIKSSIEDLCLKTNMQYSLNNLWNLRVGASLINHVFIPNTERYFTLVNNSVANDSYYVSKENALESAFYIENDVNTKHFGGNIGGRISTYHINNKNYYFFEPRLVFNIILSKNLSFKYAFSEMNQYTHLLSYTGINMPTDYWMPSTEIIEPQNSVQHSVGLFKSVFNGKCELSVEAYQKDMTKLIAFLPGESLVGHLDDWTETVTTSGQGRSKGVEMLLQKSSGKTTGWIGATLSEAKRNFSDLNSGKDFPFKYDRKIDLSIVLMHKLSENLSLSGNWSFGSGYPTTLPTERYTMELGEVYVYGNINSFRMRDFHRLDLAINYTKKTTWGENTWTFSIFNVYNRLNPYYYYFKREVITLISSSGVTGIAGDTNLYQKSLFPFFPSFAYSFKF